MRLYIVYIYFPYLFFYIVIFEDIVYYAYTCRALTFTTEYIVWHVICVYGCGAEEESEVPMFCEEDGEMNDNRVR